MGTSESKLKSNDDKGSEVQSSPSTPIKYTNSNLVSVLDPRSPSDEIFRTPIEIPTEPKEAKNLMNVIDPRSPTDQFERTPIIIKENQTHPTRRLHNKILDNARRNISYSPTLSSKTKKDKNLPISTVSPPKLISSVPSFKKSNEKRKSFVGLLETNIDFTETNLDDFVKDKSLNKSLTISINELSMCDIVEHKNCDPRSPSKDFLRTPIQIVEKVGEVEFNNRVNECETEEQVSEIDDCNTAESLLKVVGENNIVDFGKRETESFQNAVKSEDHDNIVQEIVETPIIQNEVTEDENNDGPVSRENVELSVQDDEILKTDNELSEPDDESNTEKKMAEIVDDLIGDISVFTTEDSKEVVPYADSVDSKEPIIDLTADVQEFDKKLTKIIHENNENFSFKKIISKDYLNEKARKRTPMKDRNQISEPRRNKLRVSDKPRKLYHEISKIPVFKDKNGVKSKIQCENTPPIDLKNRRKKKSQPRWDSEKTLVI